jgi:hypothetical protein
MTRELDLFDDEGTVFPYVPTEATRTVCTRFYNERHDCPGCPIKSLCHTVILALELEPHRQHWLKREDAARNYLAKGAA